MMRTETDDLLDLDPTNTFEQQAQARLARLQANRDKPPVLAAAALSGLAGDIINAKVPDTEATDAAMLITVLTAFCAVAGRGSWVMVGEQKHYPVLFSVVVGGTSKDRKGTSLSAVQPILDAADDPDNPFFPKRVSRGIGSGEALIQEVVTMGTDGSGPRPGASADSADQRLLLIETEYGRFLTVGGRQGSTLSAVVRSAWDSDSLANTTKHQRLDAANAHVCILGHVTQNELRRKMADGDESNGYANRFLHVLSTRSKFLPAPRRLSEGEVNSFGAKLRQAIGFASTAGEIDRSPEFTRDWDRVYNVIERQPDGGPMFGNMTARASAYILRLSLVYALLDQSTQLERHHLQAALAMWEYSEATIAHLWGPSLGSPLLDRLADELVKAPSGLSTTEIHKLFSNNLSKYELEDAIQHLKIMDLARTEKRQSPGGGRPSLVVVSTKA